MASEAFALPQGWRITHWEITSKEGPIPEDAFVVGGTLLVAISKETVPPIYTLAWLDASNQFCSVAGLDLLDQIATLQASSVEVKFGPTPVNCQVQVQLLVRGGISLLSGAIETEPFSTGNAGIFAAEAHIPPLPPDDRRG